MHLLILGSPNNWYVRDLRRAAARHHVDVLGFEQLDAWVGDHPGGARETGRGAPARWDGVLVRSMPRGSLEQVIFRMDLLGQWARAGVVVVNTARAMEIAIDKYLALQRLAGQGLLVPRTYVGQSGRQALSAFDQLDGDVVVKPLFGSEGRGITRISDRALAERAFKMLEQLGAVIYMQEFIVHDHQDIRLFVLGRQVWGMRRENRADWRANVSRGAVVERIEVTPSLGALAEHATRCVGAEVAGVDVLIDRHGCPVIIEVNAVPGWRALARVAAVDVAGEIVQYVETRHAARRP